MKIYNRLIVGLFLVFPLLVFAADRKPLTGIAIIIDSLREIIKMLIVLAAAVALLAFFWGLARFIFKSGDEKAVEEGKRIMKWGLVALFVMVSVWGIIGFFQKELNLPNTVENGENSNVPSPDDPFGGGTRSL